MRRSKIVYDVPEPIRRKLSARIIESGFSRYAAHSEWLARQGHRISESSVQRFGAQLQQLERIRLATREATALVDSTTDRGQLADAAVRIAQVQLYELLQAAHTGNMKDVASAARSVAELARASRSLRDERRRLLADAAKTAAHTARSHGVSTATETAIREAIEDLAEPT